MNNQRTVKQAVDYELVDRKSVQRDGLGTCYKLHHEVNDDDDDLR